MESGKKLYLECYSGISGDMTVAALLDLGADEKVLLEALESLPVSGFRVEIKRVVKSGIDACDFRVILDKEHENHDHDMEYLHGHDHSHAHGESDGHHHSHVHGESDSHHHSHVHGESDSHHHGHIHDENGSHHHDHIHEESRHHEHSHVHEHSHHHHHEHRGMREIRQIIDQGSMADGAKKLALKIFEILAQAEAKAHNMAIDEVHFHEVGAVDSIVDIVAAAVCLDNLNIHEVIVPMLCEGTGTVRCQHGILPIPVPAVANIMRSHKLPVRIVDAEGEFVTPTGAAIVAAVRTSETLPKEFAVEKVGIGAGKRNYERPGILRAMVIQDRADDQDVIWKLESNIDDCSGEVLGYVMERLFEAGARDVHYTPVFMKKNRPAWQLNVICAKEDIEKLEQIIFRETTTIGIRRMEMERTVLRREERIVDTVFGPAQVKVCEARGVKRSYPEYESVARLAGEHQAPFSQVYQTVQRCCMDDQ
ncbi:MAG: nickel pincer cofactor biosynthesis protein LarC [Hungatella sp.]|jgi:uncharacterized protein (TIGR00299 family) protein|nr:nickel pincer cofactor biosynthesis protein LarC [Hungatella sp.]